MAIIHTTFIIPISSRTAMSGPQQATLETPCESPARQGASGAPSPWVVQHAEPSWSWAVQQRSWARRFIAENS
jgi:hypothetical protein